MAALPTTTTAFASGATEAQFKTFLTGQRDYLVGLFGADGTKATAIATLGASPFPAGTAMLFAQAAAPTGWTKSTTHNDKALRVVSGAGGVSGGAVAFSTVFSKTASDGSSLSIAQLAAHAHTTVIGASPSAGSALNPSGNYSNPARETSSVGSGSTHSHGMDIRVQYVDVIIATKD